MINFEQWEGFEGRIWKEEVNVRDFIQKNYTPYDGDSAFLASATERTTRLREKFDTLLAEERDKGGVRNIDTETVITITAFGPGYLDKDSEIIVGLQTDEPLKRACNPFGGMRMVRDACKQYGYEVSPKIEEEFKYHKTHNDGVFSAYTKDVREARHVGLLTGLPDAYGRGRIIGDYRRVALYGVNRLIEEKQKDKDALGEVPTTEKEIRCAEELSDQIKALKDMIAMAASYGFDISRPAEKAKDLQPWTLRTQKGRCYLPVFTSVKMAEADKGTASRPMAERLLASAMQMALDSDSIDGVVIDPWTSSATLDCSLLNGLLHASHDTDEPGEAELRAGNHAMAEERWDDAMHYYQLSAEEGCAEGLAMMGEMLYEGRGCRKSPAQARKFWKKAADAGDVAAWVALGDDAMVQGKGAGAALRAYRKAQKLCASTPDIAYMPQVCLRVAQYETQYISRKKALAQLAEAKQGFLVRKKEGDETAQSWLDETEAVIRQLLERE